MGWEPERVRGGRGVLGGGGGKVGVSKEARRGRSRFV